MTDKEDPKSGEKSTVVSIDAARQKKSSSSSSKIKQAEVCRMLADAVSRMPSRMPDFPTRYLVLRPKPGISIPLLVAEDESVTVTTPKAISMDILRYCDGPLSNRSEFIIKPKLAAEAAEYFLSVHPSVNPADIAPTRWADEPGLTYRRLPWTKGTGPAPTWDDLLSRMSNAQAFIDWIGSLFFEQAFLHNYVWIYGEGGDGKGAINRFLSRVFDTSYRSKTAPTTGKTGTVDKFWAYNLLGARLAVFPDCENPTFTTTGFFKSLTGGDPVEVEAKGQMSFTTYLNTRYMILANAKPGISSAKSDMRRIIYCEMTPIEQDWSGIEDRLWAEGGHFLSQCIDNYLSKHPNHEPIEGDNSILLGVIDENEQHLENFFNKYFQLVDSDGYATGKEIKIAAEEAWPRSRKTYSSFLAWLKRAHNIECKRCDEERRYHGMGRKIVVSAQKNTREWD
jgi:hypothetical protein